MTDTLVFPLDERALYLRAGGALFLVIGLGLIGVWRWQGSFIWLLPGAAMVLVGFVALGYRHQVAIEAATGTVRSLKGFYFYTDRGTYQRHHFTRVEVRKNVSAETRFSNMPDQTHEKTVQVQYAVVLTGDEEVEVDATQDEAAALEWARQVAAALDLPLERTEATAEPKGQWLLPAAGLLSVLAVLGVIAFVVYQVTRSG